MPEYHHADPVGALREQIKKLGSARNHPEPTIGTYQAASRTVLLDTGQSVYNPLILGKAPADGVTGLCFYFQGANAMAFARLATEDGGELTDPCPFYVGDTLPSSPPFGMAAIELSVDGTLFYQMTYVANNQRRSVREYTYPGLVPTGVLYNPLGIDRFQADYSLAVDSNGNIATWATATTIKITNPSNVTSTIYTDARTFSSKSVKRMPQNPDRMWVLMVEASTLLIEILDMEIATGSYTSVYGPTSQGFIPDGICATPDGALWFQEETVGPPGSGSTVGKIHRWHQDTGWVVSPFTGDGNDGPWALSGSNVLIPRPNGNVIALFRSYFDASGTFGGSGYGAFVDPELNMGSHPCFDPVATNDVDAGPAGIVTYAAGPSCNPVIWLNDAVGNADGSIHLNELWQNDVPS